MKVGIDVRPVERPSHRFRGVGLYTHRLCDELVKRNQSLKPSHAFTVIASDKVSMWNGQVSIRQITSVRKPSRLQWVLDSWVLPRVLRESGIQIFHATDFTSIPLCAGITTIAHVYDMIPFLFWNEYSHQIPIDYRYALKVARKRMERASCIVTISEHSKRDIVELTGYPEGRIHVVYPGRPEEPTTAFSAQSTSRDDCPYFIYVGATDFRKNLLFLIRGFARFAESVRDIRLVLVGETFEKKRLPEVKELLKEVNRLGIPKRVDMIGYVDERQLKEIYRRSVALVFPSLYEGFGLPVLEAMTYGVPVVAAKTSSIPEVLGDTGIYFDPRDEDSLIAGLETVYRHPTRCSDLVEKAKQRAKMFSWDTVADVVFGIYDQI